MTQGLASGPELEAIETAFRDAHGQAVATLIRVFGDISVAEDAVQDAFVVALEKWRRNGVPPNPAGWIVTTARRRAIDVLRRATRGRELLQDVGAEAGDLYAPAADGWIDEEPVVDDQLRLIFTCCHPALRTEDQVALTLRLLGGLSVEEIARSFLVGEAAMAKRLVRVKYKINAAAIPYRIPEKEELAKRLGAVLAVIYLIYNTGADDPDRAALRTEAIRLGRVLAGLMPDTPETAGLLALMLLNESRMPARRSGGEVVVLRDQDRTKWNRVMIEEGHALVRSCIRLERPGPYQLQAAIQAVHCDADDYEATDWPQIVDLYDHLYSYTPTAVVALNRAIAVGEAEGAAAGLAAIQTVAADLDSYHLMHAARGSMLRTLGRPQEARIAFERAATLAISEADRRFLQQEIDQLG